ncbi:MAG TPA: hypothetical protein VE173_09920 [Longimicrobiales bacterium]|nr:hypothetical protein [Longimicrobiales bacterium]
MNTTPHPSRHRLTTPNGPAVAALLLLAACDPGGAPTALAPVLGISLQGSGPVVLNTQLAGIIDPDIEPSPGYGHLQVVLTELEDGTYQVDWKGTLFNPGGETFSLGVLGISSEPPERVVLFSSQESCDVYELSSAGIIDPEILPAEVGLAAIIDPQILEARVMSDERPAGALAGVFGPATAETSLTLDRSGDGGSRVRCGL